MRKRIAFVTTGMETGGAEMMLYKLLIRLSRDRFAPAVFCLAKSGTLGRRLEETGIPVFAASVTDCWNAIPAIRNLCLAVSRFEPHLIQGWMYHGNLAALMISAIMSGRGPVLWGVRQSLYSLRYEKWATAFVIVLSSVLSRFVNALIYNSASSALHHERYGFAKDRRRVIPNGFDTGLFSPSEDARGTVRRELGVDPATILVGIVGRLHPMKDHSNFCAAAAKVSLEMPHVRFIMIGSGLVPGNSEIGRLIGEYGLTKHVVLLGERDDVPRLMAALDMLVSSSFSEGFPNVIGEAMSCSVPCVVTDVGDCAEIVGDTGAVVPPMDPDALASAMMRLLCLSREQRAGLGHLARRRVCERYSIEAVVGRYEQLYEELAQATGPCAA